MKRHWLTAGLAAALLLTALAGCAPAAVEPEETEKPKLGYATDGVTAVEDPEALQKVVDQMVEDAAKGGITLEYKGEAIGEDGENFACYFANAAENSYDMFFAIYADDALTEELFLSELLRPGTAFSTVKLSEKLDAGTHLLYLVFTQVEEDLETIHTQVVVTVNFTVA